MKHRALGDSVDAEPALGAQLAQQETQLPPPESRIGLTCHFGPKAPIVTNCGADQTVRYASAERKSKIALAERDFTVHYQSRSTAPMEAAPLTFRRLSQVDSIP
jgi:hypothetical protein